MARKYKTTSKSASKKSGKGSKKNLDKEIIKVIKKHESKDIEHRYIDNIDDWINGSQITLSPNAVRLFPINVCQQGDRVNDRQGNQIKVETIHCAFNCWTNNFTGTTGQIVGNNVTFRDCTLRYGIIYDRVPAGALPVFSGNQTTSVFDDLTAGVAFVNMNRLMEIEPRYKLILDRTITLKQGESFNQTTTGVVNGFVGHGSHHKHNIKVREPRTHYSGNAGTSADISIGSYTLFFIADSFAVVNSNVRLFFRNLE